MAIGFKELMETPTASLNMPTYTTYDVTEYSSASITIPQYDETAVDLYNITTNCTNITASASNPTIIEQGLTATLNFTQSSISYIMPTTVTVVGATGTWTRTSDTEGSLLLSNPTGAVTVTIEGVYDDYPTQVIDSYLVLSSGSTWEVPSEMIGRKTRFALFSGFQGGCGGNNGSNGTQSTVNYNPGNGGSGGSAGAAGNQCKYLLTNEFKLTDTSLATTFGTGGTGGSGGGGTGSIGGATTIGTYSSDNGSIQSSAITNLIDSSIIYNTGLAGTAGGNGGNGGAASSSSAASAGSAGSSVSSWSGGSGGSTSSWAGYAHGGGGGGGAAYGAAGGAGGSASYGYGGTGANASTPSAAALGSCGTGGNGGGGGGGGGGCANFNYTGAAGSGGTGSAGSAGSQGIIVVYYSAAS